MTREEAKELYTPKSTYHMKMHFIDKIYDDFDKELDKARKEGYKAAADDCFILLTGKE